MSNTGIKVIKKTVILCAGVLMMSMPFSTETWAASNQPLPSAGIDLALSYDGVSVKEVKEEITTKKLNIKSAKTTTNRVKTASVLKNLGLSNFGTVDIEQVKAVATTGDENTEETQEIESNQTEQLVNSTDSSQTSNTEQTTNTAQTTNTEQTTSATQDSNTVQILNTVETSNSQSAEDSQNQDSSNTLTEDAAQKGQLTDNLTDSESVKKTPSSLLIEAVVAKMEKISAQEQERAITEPEIEPEENIEATTDQTLKETEREIDARREEEGFKNLVIAKCDGWVNVRQEATQDSEVVGKLYDKSAGEFIEEQDGWFKISSGSCTGYVNSEYVVTGEDAVALAKEVGTRICTVDTTTLKVRGEPSTEAATLGLVPMGEVLTVSEELDGWAKVNIEEGDGYVSLDYVKLSTEFVSAESKEEEEARLAKEEKEREAAREAARAANAANGTATPDYNGNDANYNGSSGKYSPSEVVTYVTEGGSALGIEVANYALQFNGNPYVYGGSDPVNGADCSGFVMAIYKHFGVSLPHSANADRKMGYAVNSLAEAQPGDLVCYSGHVGLYIGNNQIIHASTTKTGIKISDADYRQPLAIRRIF